MNKAGALAVLKAENDFLILTHRRPDGDTVGSAAALAFALKAMGKRARLFPNPGISPLLAPFFESAPCEGTGSFPIAVDFSTPSQAPEGAEKLPFGLSVDHHLGAPESAFCDETAGACGVLILDLCESMGVTLPREFYDCIFLAVATDTGSFMFSNAGEREHLAAARCLKMGARGEHISRQFFILKSPGRIRLESRVLSAASYYAEGRVASSVLTLRDLRGADEDETNNLCSLLLSVRGVKCAILFSEQENGSFKVSVRTGEEINAAGICASFGGGGHARAAGCTVAPAFMPAVLEEAVRRV